MIKLFLSFLVVITVTNRISAQDVQLTESIKSILEDLADDDSDPEAGTTYSERLYELSEKPVNLNSADESEVSRLFFLTDFQIKSITDYIHTSGRIYSVYEIMNIPGFNRELAEMIIPFITLSESREQSKDSLKPGGSLLSNFYVKYPGTESGMLGSPVKALARYKISAGRISAGLTAEKDNGEKFLGGTPPLPDFISANISWAGKGTIKKIILGDFSAKYGLGTNLNTGISSVTSLTASGFLTGGDEIRSYFSSDENNYFRGLAMSLGIRNAGISGFVSANKIDATIDSAGGDGRAFIGSLYKAGLHNTTTTLSKKDVIAEYCTGISATFDLKSIRLGLVWSGNRFTLPVKKDTTDLQKLFSFEGYGNYVSTAWYKAVTGKMILFGEISADKRLNLAWFQGLSLRPADRLIINLLYRSYDPGFTSFHGRGPFSASSGENLKGLFGNFTFEAARFLFLSAGFDFRCYPWLRYRCSAPSTGRSSEVRLLYQPARILSAELVYDHRLSVYDDSQSEGITKQSDLVSNDFKGIVKFSPSDYMTLSARFDYKLTSAPASHGIMILEDIACRFRKLPVRLWFRHAIFNTDDWNTRIYAYENDLPGSFNIPALSGKGSRSFFMVEWEPARFVKFRIKYAFSQIADETAKFTNSGELRVQVRINF